MSLHLPKWLTKYRAYWLQGGLTALILAIFLWGMSLPTDVTIYRAPPLHTLEQGWTQLVDGTAVPLDSLQDFIPAQQDIPLVIQRPITEDLVGRNLSFYAEHIQLVATAGDCPLYQLICPDFISAFGSPGRTWVNIHLPETLLGETLTFYISSPFPLYRSLPAQIYSVPDGNLFLAQFNFLWLRNTVALIILGMACITYINMHLWKNPHMRRFLFAMANVYLCVGLWLCAEVNVLAIWLKRAPLSAILAMVFLRIIPISFYHFSLTILPGPSWRTRLCSILVWTNLLLPLLLQFGFGISLIATLPFNIAVVVICSLLGLSELIFLPRSTQPRTKRTDLCYAFSLLLVGALLECHTYMNYQTNGQWTGIALTTSCILFSMVSHIHLVRHESDTAVEKRRLEQEHTQLHKKPLNQQINAHFLYNTLNTISAYCKQDPAKADIAVQKMAKYMRAYTHLVGAADYVSLEEELELIQTYMYIQNMRFGNSITFTIDNQCGDILVPPLALQPLVENAVNHGLRSRLHTGSIHIGAKTSGLYAEITVSDDGVGFTAAPAATPRPGNGVGLKNLTARITAMGGTLSVHSAPGSGTTVTLTVPQLYDEDEAPLPPRTHRKFFPIAIKERSRHE